jgi:RHS repeat-associated protein
MNNHPCRKDYVGSNRKTQVADSAGGTITEAYDNLDRLTSETTCSTGAPACGQISYGYDLAGRRASMTVAGQPQVTYSYDNANRLTQIAQGTSTVGFSYDTANRRSTLTLSNGVNMSYAYDNNSRVIGISYNFGATVLGNLTYVYDELGKRTQIGGSFAKTGLPGAVTSASYDSANQLLNWNGTAISYDNNGNMLSDGSNVFTWNARDQVATLNNVSLQYDAAGRRIKDAAGKSFFYDGANAAQELSGTTVTANLLSGGVDEVFSRADGSGALTPLADALGSTIALADANGNLVTQYSYDPFGNTTVSGTASTNPSQYTGRENEGNGLYFLRARYYNPQLGRFISEDPAGLLFGPNLYQYAYGSPTNYVDPSGLAPIDYILPDWLASHINWNYVPAVCNADSFGFYGGGGGAENIQGGAYQLDDVHYANNGGNWQVDGMESDMLYEAFGEHWGGGAVMHGRKPKEALLFPPSPYHAKRTLPLGPVKLRAEGGLGPLIGYSNDGISIGFYGDVGLGGGIGNYGGGGALGGGWSVTFSSAASCVAQ